VFPPLDPKGEILVYMTQERSQLFHSQLLRHYQSLEDFVLLYFRVILPILHCVEIHPHDPLYTQKCVFSLGLLFCQWNLSRPSVI